MPTYIPKKRFQISGDNVNFIPEISFGDSVVVDAVYEGTTGISGTVPADAISDELLINNGLGLVPYGVLQVVLDSESQVSAGYLQDDIVSGTAGDLINITGENFHRITNVRFGGVEAEFNALTDLELEAIIPPNADYFGISVLSSIRTGLNGSTSEASGITPNYFVPIANVTGLSSSSLSSGSTLEIQGESFNAVTGVSFPAMESHPQTLSVSNLSSTGLNVLIPSGRVKGSPVMHMRSGITNQAVSDISFSQDAKIFGNVTYTGHTGSMLSIFGFNYTTGTLHPVGNIEGNRSGYLVQIGDETGMFDLDPTYQSLIEGLRRLSGVVPTGVVAQFESGQVGVGTNTQALIKQLPVKIYKNDYPEQYASTGRFKLIPTTPTISDIQPSSGNSGDLIRIVGENLYGVSGVLFSGWDYGSNVGAGQPISLGDGAITDISPLGNAGSAIEVRAPSALATVQEQGNYGIVVSGSFGEVNAGVNPEPTKPSFVAYGLPKIAQGYPVPDGVGVETLVQPNDTGVISGSGIYSGTQVLLYKDSATSANLLAELPSSGYTSENDIVEFTYPNSFDHQVGDFKIKLRNPRGLSTNTKTIKAFRTPVISGFTPLSGAYGDVITVTGYFGIPAYTYGSSNTEGPVLTSGISVGNTILPNYSQLGPGNVPFALATESSLSFEIPKFATSNIINIETSGGGASSARILTTFPPKPYISGYYPGSAGKPYVTGTANTGFAEDQVFAPGNLITITGERMNLVTGVQLSGENTAITLNTFFKKEPAALTFNIPKGINPDSGHFILKDFENRSNKSSVSSSVSNKFPFPLNIVTVSGMENPSLVTSTFTGNSVGRAGDTFSISGKSISGLIPSWPTPSGTFLNLSEFGPNPITYSVGSGPDSLDVLTAQVPTGVVQGSLLLTGRSNENILQTNEVFSPLAKISSIEPGLGQGGMTVTTGASFSLTGLNAVNSTATSGSFLIGITGTGNKDNRAQVHFYPVDSYSSGFANFGSPASSLLRSDIKFQVDDEFIGTGRFFIVNSWDTELTSPELGKFQRINNLENSTTANYLEHQIESYPLEYTIQGTRVNVTGFTPSRGVTGESITVSGEGLSAVSGVLFQIPDGPRLEASFTRSSDKLINITIPKEGIEARGMTDIYLTGGTNDTINNFEILLDATAVEFNLLSEGDEPISSVRTSQYSVEEVHDGVTYIITKTRFPDGTTAIISSVPKP